jgi:hypothetical protein
MTTFPAPDVARVLDRMGRSAFGYRSFPRPDAEEDLPPPAAAAMPGAPATSSTPALFPLIAEALADAVAPPVAAHQVAAPAQGAAPPAVAPPNPFLPRAQAAPPAAVGATSLAGMFRLLSGHADTAQPPPADGARAREDSGALAPAFPFRRG